MLWTLSLIFFFISSSFGSLVSFDDLIMHSSCWIEIHIISEQGPEEDLLMAGLGLQIYPVVFLLLMIGITTVCYSLSILSILSMAICSEVKTRFKRWKMSKGCKDTKQVKSKRIIYLCIQCSTGRFNIQYNNSPFPAFQHPTSCILSTVYSLLSSLSLLGTPYNDEPVSRCSLGEASVNIEL